MQRMRMIIPVELGELINERDGQFLRQLGVDETTALEMILTWWFVFHGNDRNEIYRVVVEDLFEYCIKYDGTTEDAHRQTLLGYHTEGIVDIFLRMFQILKIYVGPIPMQMDPEGYTTITLDVPRTPKPYLVLNLNAPTAFDPGYARQTSANGPMFQAPALGPIAQHNYAYKTQG